MTRTPRAVKAPAQIEVVEPDDGFNDIRRQLGKLLPKSAWPKIPHLVEYIRELLPQEGVETVEVNDARIPVERINAYGLELSLDALGEAVTVGFPRGAASI